MPIPVHDAPVVSRGAGWRGHQIVHEMPRVTEKAARRRERILLGLFAAMAAVGFLAAFALVTVR